MSILDLLLNHTDKLEIRNEKGSIRPGWNLEGCCFDFLLVKTQANFYLSLHIKQDASNYHSVAQIDHSILGKTTLPEGKHMKSI